MARVFISFLGTSDYVPCNYYTDEGDKIENVRFVQEAVASIYCKNWTEEDRILIFTTKDAETNNWKEDGHPKREFEKEIAPEGLFKRLVNLNKKSQIINIPIKEGFSEEEITEIFNTVYEYINEDDEIIFDITHALRSIPMLAIVILNYAKVLKNIRISRIHYGPFEKLGRPEKVKKMPVEDRNVPILDLSTFDRLLDWSFGVERFVSSGDASKLSFLMQEKVKPILTSTEGQDENAQNIKRLGKGLEDFSNTIATCRGKEISRQALRNKENISEYNESGLIPAFEKLFHKVDEHFSPFIGESISDGIEASKWCRKHNYIQQGLTILQETAATYLVKIGEGNELDKNDRLICSNIIGEVLKELTKPQKNQRENEIISNSRISKDQLSEFLRKNSDFVFMVRDLGKIRNDINHAGYNEAPCSASKFKSELERLITIFEKHIFSNQKMP